MTPTMLRDDLVWSAIGVMAQNLKVEELLDFETVAVSTSLLRAIGSPAITVLELQRLRTSNFPEPEKCRTRIAAVMCMILPSLEGKIKLSTAAEEMPRLNMVLESRGVALERRDKICDIYASLVIAIQAMRNKTQ